MEESKILLSQEAKMADDKDKLANLNLKITEDERWAFKEFCVKHRMSQVDGFRLAFEQLKLHLDGEKT
jgi:hypothetical protein